MVRANLKDLAMDVENPPVFLSRMRLWMDPDKFTEKCCRMILEALKDSKDPLSPLWQDVISLMVGAEEKNPQRDGTQDLLRGLLDAGGPSENMAMEVGRLIGTVSNPEQKIPFCDFVEMSVCRQRTKRGGTHFEVTNFQVSKFQPKRQDSGNFHVKNICVPSVWMRGGFHKCTDWKLFSGIWKWFQTMR